MYREHRYRLWDTLAREMINESRDYYFIGLDGKVLTQNHQFGTYEKIRNRFIQMEYTGIFDHLGKEICDGDFLEAIYLLDGRYEKFILLVEWNQEMSRFDARGGLSHINSLGEYNHNNDQWQLLVIGNRYEHPHKGTSKETNL